MGAHIDGPIQVAIMKTTIEISDRLLREARDLAASEGITLRVVVERGLRRVVEEKKGGRPFKLRDGRFLGNGLQPEFEGASWDKFLEAIYEGRGS
jgi:hypothetical protein